MLEEVLSLQIVVSVTMNVNHNGHGAFKLKSVNTTLSYKQKLISTP